MSTVHSETPLNTSIKQSALSIFERVARGIPRPKDRGGGTNHPTNERENVARLYRSQSFGTFAVKSTEKNKKYLNEILK